MQQQKMFKFTRINILSTNPRKKIVTCAKVIENCTNFSETKYRPLDRSVSSRPRVLGYYSIDANGSYLPDSSKLKYLYPLKSKLVTFDLDKGRKESEQDNQFKGSGLRDPTINWIALNQKIIKKSHESSRLIQPNFVCDSGSLTCLMTAPYDPDDFWRIRAGKWKGTIYLCRDVPYSQRSNYESLSKFNFWGHKFKQYMTSDSPDESPDTTKPVAKKEGFFCIYQNQFGNYSVLYSSKKTAVCTEKKLSDPLPLYKLKFTDLHISRIMGQAKPNSTVRKYKFLRWWARAFLANDDKVFCGFRDDDGVVSIVNSYETDQLVKMSRSYWEPEKCIKFCETVFEKLTQIVVDDCHETIYELTKPPQEDFIIKELTPSHKNCVVPKWYKDAMSQ